MNTEQYWYISGVIVSTIIGILKKFWPKFATSKRLVKQLTALVFSILINVLVPLADEQQLPNTSKLILAIMGTWVTAMSTYSLSKTFREGDKDETGVESCLATGKEGAGEKNSQDSGEGPRQSADRGGQEGGSFFVREEGGRSC